MIDFLQGLLFLLGSFAIYFSLENITRVKKFHVLLGIAAVSCVPAIFIYALNFTFLSIFMLTFGVIAGATLILWFVTTLDGASIKELMPLVYVQLTGAVACAALSLLGAETEPLTFFPKLMLYTTVMIAVCSISTAIILFLRNVKISWGVTTLKDDKNAFAVYDRDYCVIGR